MINKRAASPAAAVADVFDGATIMIGGFGEAGSPIELIHALIDHGAKNLTVVSNNTGSGRVGLAALIANHQVAKMICSYPRSANSMVFPELYRKGEIKLELVPQGTLAERIRAGGAGIPAFYTATSIGTVLAEGKESRKFGDREYVMEHGLCADFALVKAEKADRHGNLIYNKTARNFGPIMCTAAKVAIVQVKETVEVGELNAEGIVTQGIFVNRIVVVPNPAQESQLVKEDRCYP
jgi:3-oxoadipate CoA-transferase alpha subunit